jgi:hypothetical protein
MGRDRTLARAVLIGLVAVAALALALLPSDSGQLTGIVIAVDGDLTTVRSFEVLSDGDRFVFEPSAEGDFAFPLAHLRDHLRTGEPIVVEYESVDGAILAMRVSDAE